MVQRLNEIETSGWVIKVGDVFSNGYEDYHLKVTKIELAEGDDPDDAKIYYDMVDPQNHDKVINDPLFHEGWHRAWYINECWYK